MYIYNEEYGEDTKTFILSNGECEVRQIFYLDEQVDKEAWRAKHITTWENE